MMKMIPRRTLLDAARPGRQTGGERRCIVKTRRARRKAFEAELRAAAARIVARLGDTPEALAEVERVAPKIARKHGFHPKGD